MIITPKTVELLKQGLAERCINDLAKCERARRDGCEYVLVDGHAAEIDDFYEDSLRGLKMTMSDWGVRLVLKKIKADPEMRINREGKGVNK